MAGFHVEPRAHSSRVGERLGGRAKGTPNRATAVVKEFLGGIFEEAFQDPKLRAKLLKQIVSLEIEPKLLTTLLAYYAGRPAVAVDHRVEGTLTLAELIVGTPPLIPAEDDAKE